MGHKREDNRKLFNPLCPQQMKYSSNFDGILLIKCFLITGEKYEGIKSWLKLINTSIFIKAVRFRAQNCMILFSFQ